mmetsp:Transcript_40047/g.62508  ORF Transcript_40047/g.62508 Transcript_40047/m.62508 type:complete len:104 (+) Transcript_40047:423-734(+)
MESQHMDDICGMLDHQEKNTTDYLGFRRAMQKTYKTHTTPATRVQHMHPEAQLKMPRKKSTTLETKSPITGIRSAITLTGDTMQNTPDMVKTNVSNRRNQVVP